MICYTHSDVSIAVGEISNSVHKSSRWAACSICMHAIKDNHLYFEVGAGLLHWVADNMLNNFANLSVIFSTLLLNCRQQMLMLLQNDAFIKYIDIGFVART